MEKGSKEKRYSTNRLILPVLFILCSVILEIANFLYLGFRSSSGERMFFPTYILFDLAIIIIVAGLIFLLQNKYAICVAFCLILSVQVIMGLINSTLYSLFGEVLSLALFKLGAEANSAFSFSLVNWGGVFLNLGLFLPMVTIAALLTKFNKKTFTVKHFSSPVIALAVFIFTCSLGTGLYQVQVETLSTSSAQEEEIAASDVYLWDNFQFIMEAYKKFGFFGFYAKDLLGSINGKKITEEERKTYIKYIDDGYVAGNESAPLNGDNLIVILLESMDLFSIDPVLTPVLWDMWQGNKTISLKNFRARNRTNNSEGITLLGSMPKNNMIVDAYKNGYEFDYSLPNLFKRASNDKNVITKYFHRNVASYYDRDITHGVTGVGFDKIMTVESYTGDQTIGAFGDWPTDEDFIRNLVDEFLPTDRQFLSYFSTMSTHGPYDIEKRYFDEYFKVYDEKVDDYASWLVNNGFVYPTDRATQNMLRSFKVATMDIDNTVKYILDELETRGLSDNTSIVLFADHNAYFHDLCYTMRGIEKNDFSNTEVQHIPAMIYSPRIAGEEGIIIEDFCNTYDILPTICDLFGLESNKNTMLGYSVLTEDIKHSIFVSHLGGMFTDNLYSQNITDVYIVGETVTEEEINKFKQDAINYYKKQALLEIIYYNGINGTII